MLVHIYNIKQRILSFFFFFHFCTIYSPWYFIPKGALETFVSSFLLSVTFEYPTIGFMKQEQWRLFLFFHCSVEAWPLSFRDLPKTPSHFLCIFKNIICVWGCHLFLFFLEMFICEFLFLLLWIIVNIFVMKIFIKVS